MRVLAVPPVVGLVRQAAAVGRPSERAQRGAGIGHGKSLDTACVDGHQEEPVSGGVAAVEQQLAAIRRSPVRLDVLIGEVELPDAAASRIDQEHRVHSHGPSPWRRADGDRPSIRRPHDGVGVDVDEGVGCQDQLVAPVGIRDAEQDPVRCVAQERDATPVAGEPRRPLDHGAGHDGAASAGREVHREDVAARAVRDQAVLGPSERGGQATLGAGVQHAPERQDHEERGHGEEPPRDPRRRDHAGGREGHRKPPFGERPGWALAHAGALQEDVVEVVGVGQPLLGPEELAQLALQPDAPVGALEGGHREPPAGAAVGTALGAAVGTAVARATASSSARIASTARCSRDFTVPTGTPSAAAASAVGRSR